ALASVDQYQPNIVLHGGILMAGASYTFQLVASDRIGSGSIQMTVEINGPPTGGWVTASVDAAQAYTEAVELTTEGWLDADAPLFYQFLYRVVGSSVAGETQLNNFMPLATFTSIISGEGLPEYNHTVLVYAAARDSLGATARSEINLTVWPPQSEQSVDKLSGALSSGAASAVLDGDMDSALNQVDAANSVLGAVATISGNVSTDTIFGRALLSQQAANAAVRKEMAGVLIAANGAMTPSGDTVERLAGLAGGLVEGAASGELDEDTQEGTLELLEDLVKDTRSDPLGAPLSQGAAQAVCRGLSSLNRAAAGSQNATMEGVNATTALRATAAMGVMDSMGLSMLDGFATGEEAQEVACGGLAMKVERSDASDPNSPLYAEPLETDGASVSFPAALRDALVAVTPRRRLLRETDTEGSFPGNNCTEGLPEEDGGCPAEAAEQLSVDTQVLTSNTDPYGSLTHEGATVTSSVTSIVVSGAASNDALQVRDLSEAIVFALELGGISAGEISDKLEGQVVCAFWNSTLGQYSSEGCTQLPNPYPPGAELVWRTRLVALLPFPGLAAAWELADGNLTAGCVESFNATWSEYEGLDAGLRKYLALESNEDDATGGNAGCELSRENNIFGCWWNWTHQIFSGPGCVGAPQQECFCTHLTDFKAVQQPEVGSMEPPKVKTLDTDQMASLSAEDVLAAGVLLTVVAAVMGSGTYLAFCSIGAANLQRHELLKRLTMQRGSAEWCFQCVDGLWSWALFEEDIMPGTNKTSHRLYRRARAKRKAIEIEPLLKLAPTAAGSAARRWRKLQFAVKLGGGKEEKHMGDEAMHKEDREGSLTLAGALAAPVPVSPRRNTPVPQDEKIAGPVMEGSTSTPYTSLREWYHGNAPAAVCRPRGEGVSADAVISSIMPGAFRDDNEGTHPAQLEAVAVAEGFADSMREGLRKLHQSQSPSDVTPGTEVVGVPGVLEVNMGKGSASMVPPSSQQRKGAHDKRHRRHIRLHSNTSLGSKLAHSPKAPPRVEPPPEHEPSLDSRMDQGEQATFEVPSTPSTMFADDPDISRLAEYMNITSPRPGLRSMEGLRRPDARSRLWSMGSDSTPHAAQGSCDGSMAESLMADDAAGGSPTSGCPTSASLHHHESASSAACTDAGDGPMSHGLCAMDGGSVVLGPRGMPVAPSDGHNALESSKAEAGELTREPAEVATALKCRGSLQWAGDTSCGQLALSGVQSDLLGSGLLGLDFEALSEGSTPMSPAGPTCGEAMAGGIAIAPAVKQLDDSPGGIIIACPTLEERGVCLQSDTPVVNTDMEPFFAAGIPSLKMHQEGGLRVMKEGFLSSPGTTFPVGSIEGARQAPVQVKKRVQKQQWKRDEQQLTVRAAQALGGVLGMRDITDVAVRRIGMLRTGRASDTHDAAIAKSLDPGKRRRLIMRLQVSLPPA
ncbi:hypothetical protein CYMTET_27713, partial [Cymbomonas tetramitiformis]